MPFDNNATVLASAQKNGELWTLVLDSYDSKGNALYIGCSSLVGVSGVSTSGVNGVSQGYLVAFSLTDGVSVGPTVLGAGSGGGGGGTFNPNNATLTGTTTFYSTAGGDIIDILVGGNKTVWVDTTGLVHAASGITANSLTLTNPLPISSGGTGTTTPGIVAGTGITVANSWPNQTISTIATNNFLFVQSPASSAWSIVHNLNGFPAAVFVASGSTTPTNGSITYPDRNTMNVTFTPAIAGSAYLVSRSTAAFIFTQVLSNTTWSITHNLNGFPLVVTELAGTPFTGTVSYTSNNALTITFSSAKNGTAQLII